MNLRFLGLNNISDTADTNFWQDQFSAQVGSGQIEIINGNPDGTHRVTSGSVSLNGLQLLGPDDFKNYAPYYQFPVNLTESNFLTVQIQGTPGDFLTIRVTQGDNIQTITASAGPNGTISPSGAVSVNYGANQSFTITPDRQLPRGGRPGGRRLRGGGDQLHLHQRHRQPHHRRQLRHRHLHHHGLGRVQRDHLARRARCR